MDKKQRIDHYIQRLSDKHFEIYDVRRELEQQNVDEAEIKEIVRAVDEELQARLLKNARPDASAAFIRIGIILMSIGIILGVATLLGAGDLFIFIYSAFIGGLSMLLIGAFKRKRSRANETDENNLQGTRRRVSFRRKSE